MPRRGRNRLIFDDPTGSESISGRRKCNEGPALFAAFARYRPRVLTLLLAALVAAPLLLANLTGEFGTRRVPAGSLPTREVARIALGNASNTDRSELDD